MADKPTLNNILYSTETGKEVRLPIEEIPKAILSGTVAFKKNETIPVISPEGKSGTIDSSEVAAAISSGFKLQSPHQLAVEQYVKENAGISGSLKVGLNNFANQASFGIGGIIYDHTASDLDKAKWKALEEQHKAASVAGDIAGFGASLFVGGPLFKGATKAGTLAEAAVLGGEKAAASLATATAEKALTKQLAATAVEELGPTAAKQLANQAAPSLLRSAAANMAKYGVEGAVLSAPQAITEEMFSDHKAAAEHLAAGIGGGIVLGGLGTLGSKFLGLTKDLIKFDSNLLVAGNTAAKAAGMERGSSLKAGLEDLKSAGDILLSQKLKSDGRTVIPGPISLKDFIERVNIFKKESGSEMRDILTDLDSRLFKYKSSSYAGVEQAIKDALAANPKLNPNDFVGIAKAIKGSQAAREAIAAEVSPSFENVIDKLKELQNKYNEPIFKKEFKEVGRIIETVEKRLGIENGVIDHSKSKINSFSEMQDLKEMIYDLTNFDKRARGQVNVVRKEAGRIVREEIDNGIQSVAEKLNQPDIYDAFMQAKKNYSAGADISKLLEIKAAKSAGNKIFGLTDNVMFAGGISGGIAATAMAGNFVPLFMAALPVVGKKILESTYFQTGAAKALKALENNKTMLLFTEKALKQSSDMINKVDDAVLGNLPSLSQTSSTAIQRFIGSEKEYKSIEERKQALKELSIKLNDLTYNNERLSTLSNAIAAGGAPRISMEYLQHQMKTYEYLRERLPNVDKQINPFGSSKSQISDADLAKYERALNIVQNPYAILQSISSGKISQSEVDVLKQLYPSIYDSLRTKILESANAGKYANVNYATKLRLSVMLGIPIDDSIAKTSTYQSNFAQQAPTSNSNKVPRASKLDIKPNSYNTPISNLTFGIK